MKFLVMLPLFKEEDFHFIWEAHGLVVPLFISIIWQCLGVLISTLKVKSYVVDFKVSSSWLMSFWTTTGAAIVFWPIVRKPESFEFILCSAQLLSYHQVFWMAVGWVVPILCLFMNVGKPGTWSHVTLWWSLAWVAMGMWIRCPFFCV